MIFTLLYHDIARDESCRINKINPLYTTLKSDLIRQIHTLDKMGYEFIDLRSWIKGEYDQSRESKRIHISFDGCFRSWIDVTQLLKQMGVPATFYVVSSWLTDTENKHPYQGEPSLSSQELKRMHGDGFCIGSHSVTHYPFRIKENESHDQFLERVLYECQQSKLDLQKVLEFEIEHFATPNGVHSTELSDLLRDLGYQSNRNVKKKTDKETPENPYDLGIYYCDTALSNHHDFVRTFGGETNRMMHFLARVKRRFLRSYLQNKYARKIQFEWEDG